VHRRDLRPFGYPLHGKANLAGPARGIETGIHRFVRTDTRDTLISLDVLDRNYHLSGIRPWLYKLPQAERQFADLQMRMGGSIDGSGGTHSV
jgi:hypothetical protein